MSRRYRAVQVEQTRAWQALLDHETYRQVHLALADFRDGPGPGRLAGLNSVMEDVAVEASRDEWGGDDEPWVAPLDRSTGDPGGESRSYDVGVNVATRSLVDVAVNRPAFPDRESPDLQRAAARLATQALSGDQRGLAATLDEIAHSAADPTSDDRMTFRGMLVVAQAAQDQLVGRVRTATELRHRVDGLLGLPAPLRPKPLDRVLTALVERSDAVAMCRRERRARGPAAR